MSDDDIIDDDDIKTDDTILEPIKRLSRDIRQAALTLGDEEARYLVDAYYLIQDDRKRSFAQQRTLQENAEPNQVIQWLAEQSKSLENQIKNALDIYTKAHPMGSWMRCAPGTAEVWTAGRRRVRISDLHDGDEVISFNRHHARLSRPKQVIVGTRPYAGELLGVRTSDHLTEVTPNHRWLTRFKRKDEGVSVYLMQSGDRYRVGRTNLFTRRKEGDEDYLRFGAQMRARTEQASVWILRIFSTDREAAIYEHFISAQYGLTECCFRAARPGGRLGFNQQELDTLYALFNAQEMHARAERCLRDHGRYIEAPLWSWTGDNSKQTPTFGIETHAANLMPEIMQVPIPTPVYAGVDWLDISAIENRWFEGPVYSLDVAEHHKYIQDGIITCNSVHGIGPVISAGLLAHIDIKKCPTAGHIWQFAGIAGEGQKPWEKGKPRPFNAKLKTLTWKAGQSFMKLSNDPKCIYGRLYREQKAKYIARNEADGFHEQALERAKKVGKTTEAYKHYSVGKYPPGHIDAMARRWAVKVFLSHLHMAWYEQAHGKPPPAPFPVQILGHAHLIPGP
jgi:hypothetical protein